MTNTDKSLSRWRCALVQADTRWANPPANRDNLARLMDRAPDCDLYVLPETCTTGFLGDNEDGERLAELEQGLDQRWLIEQALARGAAIAASIVAIEDERARNRFVLARPDGSHAQYDKKHLFSFGGEDKRYAAGDQRVRAPLFGRSVDLQVCYDLRFPVWCRNNQDFDLQIYVANWPKPRVAHWDALLRARAIENQAYVIGVNRAGVDGKGVEYTGSSSVWDALGQPVVEPLDEREQVVEFELDFDALDEVRLKFPFLADRDEFSIC